MVCPYCHQETRVNNSRPQGKGFSVWRRRHCSDCKITFTTGEHIMLESVIALKAPDGSLSPLRRSDIYLSCHRAVKELKDASELADRLSQTIVDKLFGEGAAVIEQGTLENHIFSTLNTYEPLAGQAYLINELRRADIDNQ